MESNFQTAIFGLKSGTFVTNTSVNNHEDKTVDLETYDNPVSHHLRRSSRIKKRADDSSTTKWPINEHRTTTKSEFGGDSRNQGKKAKDASREMEKRDIEKSSAILETQSSTSSFNDFEDSGFHENLITRRKIRSKESTTTNSSILSQNHRETKRKDNAKTEKSKFVEKQNGGESLALETFESMDDEDASHVGKINSLILAGKNRQTKRKVNVKTEKSKFVEKQNGDESLALETLQSLVNEWSSQVSDCSTYFSGAEDIVSQNRELQTGSDENRLELDTRKVAETRCLKIVDDIRVGPVYFVRLLLRTLEDESLTLEYTVTSRWHGTMAKEAVDAFVGLVESGCASGAARQMCINEAVRSISMACERFLNFSNSHGLHTDVHWMNHFTILFALCDSKTICEEFVKFFINLAMTPKCTEDSDDPDEIIKDSIVHDQTRFFLIRLNELLRKYETNVKTVCETTTKTNFDIWKRIQPNENQFDIKLLTKLEEYNLKNLTNFPVLAFIASKNLSLLKNSVFSRKQF